MRERGEKEKEKRTQPFIKKHGAFEAVFLPLLTVVMVDTDMAELVKYGDY